MDTRVMRWGAGESPDTSVYGPCPGRHHTELVLTPSTSTRNRPPVRGRGHRMSADSQVAPCTATVARTPGQSNVAVPFALTTVRPSHVDRGPAPGMVDGAAVAAVAAHSERESERQVRRGAKNMLRMWLLPWS